MIEREHPAPDDLVHLVIESLRVPRFVGYREGIFVSNTGFHTVSCVVRVRPLPLNERSKGVVRRTLWVHDLPEIITFDVTAPRKDADQDLAQDLRAEEEKAAQQLLSPSDQELLKAFNVAGDALRGQKVQAPVSPEAVIAKIVDVVDSNELFHHQLAMWTASDRYDPGKMPEEAALVYTTDLYQRYQLNLAGLGLSQEFEDLAMDLLVNQLRWVVDQWREVPQERTPLVLQEKLRWAEKELESMSKDR